ncbi:MAG: patatin-like phospholipase family protein, partial [Pseudomonadota bacterium]
LDVLEKAHIPIDVLSGSSMGGIVALTLARKGNVGATIRQVQEQLGANKKIRDRALLPRGSIFTGAKIAQAAENTFGDCTFSDLALPVSVAAADIAGGERVILDRGEVRTAVLATSAIPGFFPPIARDQRLLVDGGVVSWVPVDVLSHRRCGLRIAVNVLPLTQDSQQDIVDGFEQLGNKLRKPLGLKSVLGSSWELLGSWGSTRETLSADVVITPITPARAGYDFDQFETIVECGRRSALERIEAVAELVKNTLHT